MTEQKFKSPTSIETLSGRQVDVYNIKPSDLHLEDIAHGLATKSRWSGFYDLEKTGGLLFLVAQHAVICAREVLAAGLPATTALFALHHDDSEGFLNDMASPIKRPMHDYKALEELVQGACYMAFCGGYPEPAVQSHLHTIDMFVQSCEAKTLGKTGHYVDPNAPPLADISHDFYIWTPLKAKAEFMRLHEELVALIKQEEPARRAS